MVKPTVGLPLLLGSVTVIAILVHYAVLSNTTWFPAYWNGGTKAKAAMVDTSSKIAAVETGYIIK